MIPKDCKRLAEVDFPIAVVSKHSAREKSIRHGHPSTLHLWWARRPLAACRAMLLGLLLPDPCDPQCPQDFKQKARKLLSQVQGLPSSEDKNLRQSLLKFIGDFANWDLSNDRTYLEVSKELVKAAHPEEKPLVVDPFAGGGSIPLEALRLGCETFASDLNPVACLILKVMLEDIPRHGPTLAEELTRVGQKIKEEAEKELAEFYPSDHDSSRPIAYLWARTVRCEAPNCGAEIPLIRSFWLSKKLGRKRALRYKVVRPTGESPRVEFEIFEPKNDSEVPEGTVTRAKATCLCCNTVLPPERVRAQLTAQRGGADVIFGEKGNRSGGARLLAVVTLKPGEQGRNYRLSTGLDYEAVWKAKKHLGKKTTKTLPNGLSLVPNEPLPKERIRGNSGFRVLLYGMETFSDLFTARQKLALASLTDRFRKQDGNVPLALGFGKIIRHCNVVSFWHKASETVAGAFGRQALPMCWDFPEYYFFSSYAGGFDDALNDIIDPISNINSLGFDAQTELADSVSHPLPDYTAAVWFTDPPYYDAISYADLSDFFFVWYKRMLPNHPLMRDPFDFANPLTPKIREVVQDEARKIDGHPKDRVFFEKTMSLAFKEGRRILKDGGIGCVVFAHKTTEGWEALLTGLIQGGWTITASWPIATERGARLMARESAALATSVHLVCRPRPEDAPVGDWGNVLRELPNRVGDWMERLQSEGIRGADLVFACIGPALEIFSRYSKVETAEGREVKLNEYLEKVWEVVGRIALEQVLGTEAAKARNGTAGALEEDARLTALFLWTLQSTNGNSVKENNKDHKEDIDEEEDEEISKKKTKGFTLIFDVVRRFAQPLGIHLPGWEGRIIETKKGIVRLLSVQERAKQLFGEDGAQAVADQLEKDTRESLQGMLFPDVGEDAVPIVRGKRRQRKSRVEISKEAFETRWEATTLDRVHAAMLLQASGRANALRSLLKSEQERGPEFLRLANALSALYPKNCEEKRLLDAMLLAAPR
jgi:adenine-specific DNA methylase